MLNARKHELTDHRVISFRKSIKAGRLQDLFGMKNLCVSYSTVTLTRSFDGLVVEAQI